MSNNAVMMPKRVIYWNEDASGWYDLETDVAVENMPHPSELKTSVRTPNGTAVAINNDSNHPHPFDKSEKVSYEVAQAMINKSFDARTIWQARMYFNADPEDDKLVTVGYMKRVLMNSEKTTYDMQRQLQQRITVLERPWWKRWLNR